jgi:hypothetical protein
MRDLNNLKEIRKINIKEEKDIDYWSGHIKICRDGNVELRYEDEGFLVDYDVTLENILLEYIHWRVVLDKDVVLMDIFDLLLFNPSLKSLYSRFLVDEFIEEAITDKSKHDDSDGKIVNLEIQKCVNLDEDSCYDWCHFSGYGEDENGDATPWGIALSSAAHIKNLPIVLKNMEVVTSTIKEFKCKWLKKIVGKRIYRKIRRKYETYYLLKPGVIKEFPYEYTLDEILYSIFFEMSFYGGPKEKKVVFKDIDDGMKEGSGKGIPADEFFDRMDDMIDSFEESK